MIEIAKLYEAGEIDIDQLFNGEEFDEILTGKFPWLSKAFCKVCRFLTKGLVRILKKATTREAIAEAVS